MNSSMLNPSLLAVAFASGAFSERIGYDITLILGSTLMLAGLAVALFFPPSFIIVRDLKFLPYLYACVIGAGGGTFQAALWSLLGSFNPLASFSGSLSAFHPDS